MSNSIEFIIGIDAKQRTLARAPETSPIGLAEGTVIEIHYRDYRIKRINPIVFRKNNNYEDCSITYQIHVEEVK